MKREGRKQGEKVYRTSTTKLERVLETVVHPPTPKLRRGRPLSNNLLRHIDSTVTSTISTIERY